MVNRVKAFLKVGTPRNKTETVKTLRSYFTEASKVDTKTKLTKARTETGVKDTYQMVFLDKLFASYKHKRQHHRQAALDEKVAEMDIKKTMSPVWRIRGLDPHSDTPVEILHVVLLGFVKYMWRDVIQNQLKNQDQKKADLAARLSSVDVTGLGISPLAGQTLVQYAGSLTGRDFRAIAQIRNVETHIALLEKEIDHFLLCAARWTVRWFNKPKFHLLLHLPDHIRRFGPAIIFATEVFESFNAVIRAKSIHSNRQAPSRDIARAFAQGNRIRHLLSGGLFVRMAEDSEPENPGPDADSSPHSHFSFNKNAWRSVGPGPSGLVHIPNTVTQYLGLDSYMHLGRPIGGFCVLDDKLARPFSGLASANHLDAAQRWKHHDTQKFKTASELHLINGDKCIPGSSYVIMRLTEFGETCVARVEEVILIQGSANALSLRPDGVLVQKIDVSQVADSYSMPLVGMCQQYAVVPLESLLCTVNVQHNCASHGCDLSAHRPVFQERVETQFTRAATAHRFPRDLVLNTAQMRDAVLLQPFRIPSTALNMDDIVTASAAREVKMEKTKQQQALAGGTSVSTASPAGSSGEQHHLASTGRSLRVETLHLNQCDITVVVSALKLRLVPFDATGNLGIQVLHGENYVKAYLHKGDLTSTMVQSSAQLSVTHINAGRAQAYPSSSLSSTTTSYQSSPLSRAPLEARRGSDVPQGAMFHRSSPTPAAAQHPPFDRQDRYPNDGLVSPRGAQYDYHSSFDQLNTSRLEPRFTTPSSPDHDGQEGGEQQVEHGQPRERPYTPPIPARSAAESNVRRNASQAPTQITAPGPFVMSAIYLDRLSKDLNLETEQSNILHTFDQLGAMDPDVSHIKRATRAFMLAAILSLSADSQRRDRLKESDDISMKDLLRDLYNRLEDTFTFNKEQRANMRLIAQDIVYQHTRTAYKNMHIDAEKILRANAINYSFNNVFGKPAREQLLIKELKRVCSSVRNGFRLDLIKGLFGKQAEALSNFTYSSAMKYKHGGNGESLDPKFMIHIALLRRFCLEHPDFVIASQPEPSSASDVESDTETADSTATSKKRRKGRGGGRIPNGEDFWSKMDAFFADGIKERGRSLTNEMWKTYSDESIRMDNAKYDTVARSLTPSNSAAAPFSSAAQPFMPGSSSRGPMQLSSLLAA
ncbi:hypothetical protein EUX98_g8121 [Antrodiella citrinella]|uniref:Uncharacterized protein n=1 Tax=Antrodiella citrinella TaxID=2447956 RepID=A0A4S4MDS3_9APHY|nr:hypothetical protein EUX98_g8121 [Antrodiella citrinella]